MFNNLKLSTKIAAGFVAILMITLCLGVMAVWTMKTTQIDATKLSTEYVPEVDVANEVERDSLMTMYNVRGYSLTGQKSFYENGKKHLIEVEGNLKKAEELAARSPDLVALKGNVEKAKTNVKMYSDLLEETAKHLDEVAKVRVQLNEAAAVFMKNSEAFLEHQTEALEKEIKEHASASKLQERFQKTILINDVIELGNATRIAVWKGQALNDDKVIEEIKGNLAIIKKKIAETRPLVHQEENLKELSTIEASGELYFKGIEEYLAVNKDLVVINQKRGAAGDEVLEASRETSQKGIKHTAEIADSTASKVTQAFWVLVIGLLAAVAIGATLAYVVTMAVSRPLKAAIDGIKNATGHVGAASEQLSSAAQQLSSGANEQASAIEETSASLEEMLGMVQNNVTNAKKANELSNQVKNISEQGNESMDKLQDAMREILASNDKIEQLVKVIGEIGEKTKVMDEIVFQTKLLSFNASVEAERAGEHGRGFAVVAQEVGNLAQMSGKSAQEISQILSDSIKQAEVITSENKSRVEAGNAHVVESGKILREINSSAGQVVEGAAQVSSASEEQATGIKQITTAMSNLDRAVQENAATAEETASTSEELNAQAEALNALVQGLVELMDGKNNASQGAGIEVVSQLKSAPVTKQATLNIHKSSKSGNAKVHNINSAKKNAPRPKADLKAVVGGDVAPTSGEGGWDEL